jgi:hypothetical protein
MGENALFGAIIHASSFVERQEFGSRPGRGCRRDRSGSADIEAPDAPTHLSTVFSIITYPESPNNLKYIVLLHDI